MTIGKESIVRPLFTQALPSWL